MKRFLGLVLTCILILGALVGCTPAARLEERLIIRSMAVDYDNEYVVTVQSYRSKKEGGEKFELISARGESVYEALGHLEGASGRLPFYSELAVIIVGDAAIQQGLSRLLGSFVRENQIRMGVYTFYTKSRAADLLTLEEAVAPDEELIGVAKAQLSTPVLDASRLYNVVGRIQGEGQDALLPVLYTHQEGDDRVYRVDRVLCFRDDVPVIELDADRTETLGWVLGGISTENMDIYTAQEETVIFCPVSAESRIWSTLDGEKLSFSLELRQNLKFLPLHSDGMEKDEQDELMKRSGSELLSHMQQRVNALMNEVLCSAGSDVFLFGLHLRQQQPEYWKKLGKEARQTVHHAPTEVKIHLQIGEG